MIKSTIPRFPLPPSKKKVLENIKKNDCFLKFLLKTWANCWTAADKISEALPKWLTKSFCNWAKIGLNLKDQFRKII